MEFGVATPAPPLGVRGECAKLWTVAPLDPPPPPPDEDDAAPPLLLLPPPPPPALCAPGDPLRLKTPPVDSWFSDC